MTVDVHAHVIVPEMLRDAGGRESWRPAVRTDGGVQVVGFGGREIRSAVHEFVDADRIVAAQARAGIDHTVLSPWVPLLFSELPAEEALSRCRIQNEGLATLVDSHPTRISALGCVPLQAPELAASELETLDASGSLAGIEVPASVGGVYLGDSRFEPVWDAAERAGALVFVHPTTRGLGVRALEEGYLWNTVGNPLETTISAAHMTMAGVMERHPGLRVLLAHAGGALLSLRGRLTHAHGFQAQARSRLTESPIASMRRFHYDTVTHDPDLLRELIAFVGPDRVLVGSDYPFDMGDPAPVETVRSAGLEPQAEKAVLDGNAHRLLAASASMSQATT